MTFREDVYPVELTGQQAAARAYRRVIARALPQLQDLGPFLYEPRLALLNFGH